MNKLTKRQKQIETHRALKKIIMHDFIPKVLKSLKDEINSLDKDSYLLDDGSQELKNLIIKKFSLNCE
tara:strand:+ start:527 stop:730 length:204 start_codon:yes stop_codon:yes gene_type:complete